MRGGGIGPCNLSFLWVTAGIDTKIYAVCGDCSCSAVFLLVEAAFLLDVLLLRQQPPQLVMLAQPGEMPVLLKLRCLFPSRQ